MPIVVGASPIVTPAVSAFGQGQKRAQDRVAAQQLGVWQQEQQSTYRTRERSAAAYQSAAAQQIAAFQKEAAQEREWARENLDDTGYANAEQVFAKMPILSGMEQKGWKPEKLLALWQEYMPNVRSIRSDQSRYRQKTPDEWFRNKTFTDPQTGNVYGRDRNGAPRMLYNLGPQVTSYAQRLYAAAKVNFDRIDQHNKDVYEAEKKEWEKAHPNYKNEEGKVVAGEAFSKRPPLPVQRPELEAYYRQAEGMFRGTAQGAGVPPAAPVVPAGVVNSIREKMMREAVENRTEPPTEQQVQAAAAARFQELQGTPAAQQPAAAPTPAPPELGFPPGATVGPDGSVTYGGETYRQAQGAPQQTQGASPPRPQPTPQAAPWAMSPPDATALAALPMGTPQSTQPTPAQPFTAADVGGGQRLWESASPEERLRWMGERFRGVENWNWDDLPEPAQNAIIRSMLKG